MPANATISAKIVQASIPVIYAIVNMFCSSKSWDLLLKGFETAYKFEVICDDATAIAAELMQKLDRGVTVLEAKGMYTNSKKQLLICIVPKKQITQFKKIIKSYPNTFAYITSASEVMGEFLH
jgi:uncharacterized membrane-anchored protein YitT (DUF2179 family)